MLPTLKIPGGRVFNERRRDGGAFSGSQGILGRRIVDNDSFWSGGKGLKAACQPPSGIPIDDHDRRFHISILSSVQTLRRS